MSKEMKMLLARFHTYGIFPSDKQMTEALGADMIHSALTGEKVEFYWNIYDLELSLINQAIDNVKHPYHYMVCSCNGRCIDYE